MEDPRPEIENSATSVSQVVLPRLPPHQDGAVHETRHFVIYSRQGSYAHRNLGAIGDRAERALRRVAEALQVDLATLGQTRIYLED